MNERIKELADQAYIGVVTTKGYPDVIDGCYVILPEKLNKFAELIVKECIELNRQELAFNAFERLLNLYKEHFGVE